MKKVIICCAVLLGIYSCSTDKQNLETQNVDLTATIDFENTNLGIYKGVFTTLDSKTRATVEINIPDGNVQKVYPTATLNLQNNQKIKATASTIAQNNSDIVEMLFSGNQFSFTFSVNADGTNPTASNVIFKDSESDILLAKHTNRAPVTPINGTYGCFDCKGIPNLDNSTTRTFNMIYATPGGNGAITTQVVLDGAVYNSGIGVQETCNINGSFTRCNIESGDGLGTTTGFIANGFPVTWVGNHTFNNGVVNCSEVKGLWTLDTPNYGLAIGYFISDSTCPNPTVEVQNTDYTFNDYRGAGFSPTPSAQQLNSNNIIADGFSGNLNYGGTATSGDFARGQAPGGVGTGGIYAFEVAGGDFALGVQPGGSDFTPGYFEIRGTNNTGNNITSLTINYDIYVFNDQDRTNSLNFSYSKDGSTFTDVTDLDFASPGTQDAVPVWVKTSQSATIYVDLRDGENLYLRFTGDDISGSGSRDQFAIDNISVTEIE